MTFARGNDLTFKSASKEDARILWEWRNDATTREASFNQDQISWETHSRWFHDSLQNENRRIFLVFDQDLAVGMIRSDVIGPRQCELSWMISPAMRGRGYGKKMLSEFTKLLSGLIVAKIRIGNIGSEKMAASAGFEQQERSDLFSVWVRRN